MVTGRRYGPAMSRTLAEVVFPAVCPGCGGRGEPLCAACARTIRPAPRCRHRPGSTRCTSRSPTRVSCASSSPGRSTGGGTPRSRGSARAMVATLAAHRAGRRRDLGAHDRRPGAGQRGFDQAEVLARAVAGALGCPSGRCCAGSATATRRDGRARSAWTRPRSRSGRRRRSPAGRVLVVDDVVTTGATLARRGAALLRRAGAASVVGLGRGPPGLSRGRRYPWPREAAWNPTARPAGATARRDRRRDLRAAGRCRRRVTRRLDRPPGAVRARWPAMPMTQRERRRARRSGPGGSEMTMEIVVRGRNVAVDAGGRRRQPAQARASSRGSRPTSGASTSSSPRSANPRVAEVAAVRGHRPSHPQPREGARRRRRRPRPRSTASSTRSATSSNRVHDKRVHRARPRHPAPPAVPADTAD